MHQRYVFAAHETELGARAAALVEEHRPGHGVRAVAPTRDDADFAHVLALQAPDEQALHALLETLQLQSPDAAGTTESRSLSLTVCGDQPCEKINQLFDVYPSHLPICDQLVFLVCEFERDVHELVDELVIPPVGSHLAGVAIAEGNTLLIELGNDDPDELEKDVERLRSIPYVKSVRTLHAAGRQLVRSPHR